MSGPGCQGSARRLYPGLVGLIGLIGLCGIPAMAGPEYSLMATHLSGDYAGGVSSDSQVLTLRCTTGQRHRFTAYLPALSVQAPRGIAWTSLGPLPLSRDQQRRRDGSSSGRRSGAGGGGGSGPSAPMVMPAEEPGDPTTDRVSGIGDLRLLLSSRILGGGVGLHRMDAEIEVKVPTADEEEGLGTGEWDARAGLGLERRFWSLTAFGGLGWNRIGDPEWLDFHDAVDGYLGLETEAGHRGLRWSAWIDASGEAVPGAGSRSRVGVGLRSSTALRWHLSVTAGLTEAAEDVGLSLGLAWGGGSRRPALARERRS